MASVAYAQDGSDAQPDDSSAPADASAPPPPPSPVLQPSDYTPSVCDPNAAGFRYVEVRGTGFDAYATQHLIGNVVDGNGSPQMQWNSVWVSPQGSLTLEVNLCADPFRSRPALPAGDYTISVGAPSGQPIAATSIALSPPAGAQAADQTDQSGDQSDQPQATATPLPTATPSTLLTPSPVPFVLPNIQPAATPTPLPAVMLPSGTSSTPAQVAATPTPQPNGPGSRQRPFPVGAPGTLTDGWQMNVTGVTPDAWSGIQDSVPGATAPASDLRDYEVNVQATFLGQGTGVFSGIRLALMTGSGTVYDQIKNSCGTVPSMIPPNLMTPGGNVRGIVCFQVRASDIGNLVLFDNQSVPGSQLFFALQ